MPEWLRALTWGALAGLVAYRVTSHRPAASAAPEAAPVPFQRTAEAASAAEAADVESAALAAVLAGEDRERFRFLLLAAFQADAEWADAMGNHADAETVRRNMETLAEAIVDSGPITPEFKAHILARIGLEGIDRA